VDTIVFIFMRENIYRNIVIIMIPFMLSTMVGIFVWFDKQIQEVEDMTMINSIDIAINQQNVDLIPEMNENIIIICNALRVHCK